MVARLQECISPEDSGRAPLVKKAPLSVLMKMSGLSRRMIAKVRAETNDRGDVQWTEEELLKIK